MRPKIGLALGSGGARGFAHLGVLRALQDENIPIDIIAGSSMGSLIGAFYGAGHDMSRLYKLATAFRRKYYLDFTVPKMGFITGNRVKDLIHIFTKGKQIEELDVKLGVIATDLIKGTKRVFTQGNLPEAVRASISIPGIFVPVKIDGNLYVDGGVIDRVPITTARELGADLVIAVDVSHVKADVEITSIYDVIMQSIDILQDELVKSRGLDADVMIVPDVTQFSSRAFTNLEEIIQIGEEETRQHIPLIKSAISSWEGVHHGKS
ncbi:patatin-like phospholipase family protein [Bacillus solimangrovi]|uniref:Esterase n=1 Tax=Bacillus solimangrovi TaxID=1305675 RepID=A0A1E5LIM6_9BACI|nr:patatin-like phospholipase family protein [Bacillus solimangrovi]OEH93934.1 esterase [Bacillus solimangrovi]